MDRRTFLKSSGAVTVSGIAAPAAASASLAGSELEKDARILTVASATQSQGSDETLALRRLSERTEWATGKKLQIAAGDETTPADLKLASVAERLADHPAWLAHLPLLHGMTAADYNGWMMTGGGTPLLEQLEAETAEKILFLVHRHAPHGVWADRELLGLHQRPSLAVSAQGRMLLETQEPGAGIIDLHLSAGLTEDLQSGYFNTSVLHALPSFLSGEPLALTMSWETWSELSEAEQTILTSLVAEEAARSLVEGYTTTQMARTASALPMAIALPGEFKQALATAIDDARAKASANHELAAQMFASQNGFRSITGATDLAYAARHFANLA